MSSSKFPQPIPSGSSNSVKHDHQYQRPSGFSLISLSRQVAHELLVMPSAEEFGTTADERFDLAYTVALEELNVTDQPAWKDIVRLFVPEMLVAGGPNEDLTLLTKRKALDKINRLKCEGCELVAMAKVYHEYNQGCKSSMATRLAAIDLSEAYSEAAADLRSDVVGRVIESLVVEKD